MRAERARRNCIPHGEPLVGIPAPRVSRGLRVSEVRRGWRGFDLSHTLLQSKCNRHPMNYHSAFLAFTVLGGDIKSTRLEDSTNGINNTERSIERRRRHRDIDAADPTGVPSAVVSWFGLSERRSGSSYQRVESLNDRRNHDWARQLDLALRRDERRVRRWLRSWLKADDYPRRWHPNGAKGGVGWMELREPKSANGMASSLPPPIAPSWHRDRMPFAQLGQPAIGHTKSFRQQSHRLGPDKVIQLVAGQPGIGRWVFHMSAVCDGGPHDSRGTHRARRP